MAWSESRIFAALIEDAVEDTTDADLNGGTPTAALYNNSITPDRTVSAANTAYNAGQWANTNEVSEAGQWAAGGVALAGNDVTRAAGVITFDANDVSSGANADLADVHGVLVYDNAATVVADQGISYHYLGGANSVVDGTFTVVWNAAGLWTITV